MAPHSDSLKNSNAHLVGQELPANFQSSSLGQSRGGGHAKFPGLRLLDRPVPHAQKISPV